MKFPILPLFTFFFFFSSCAQEANTTNPRFDANGYQQASYGSENQFPDSDPNEAQTDRVKQVQNTQQSSSESTIVWYPVRDSKSGMISSKIPMPSTWTVKTATQDDPSVIKGPQGFKSYNYQGQNYMYTEDQFMAQSYSQAGVQMKAPIDVASLVQQEIIRPAAQQGVRALKNYHLPELAAVDRNYNSQLYGSQNSQSFFDAYVTEWKDKDGKLSMSIVRYYSATSMGMTYWGYTVSGMEANDSYYEQAKTEYINALVKTKQNPKQIAQYNANERAKEQQSWSQHNQRMASNQQAFEASQQAYRTSQEASDIQMQGWKNNNTIQEQGHSNYINSINEVQVVTDPNNGQSYQVEAGANQTWMNGNGEYIQSNDYFYNPNTDPNVDQYKWEDTGGWDD
jgi:hypothetical protein